MVNIQPALSKLKERRLSGPKLVIVAASLITIAITTVEMWRGALTIGSSTDEAESIGLLEQALNNTWDPNGTWGIRADSIAFTKGNTFQILSHLANILRGNETWGQFSYGAESLAVQHLLIAVLAIATFVAAGLISWIITASITAGIFTAALLASTPVFIGHSMLNPKDIPTAAGFTFLTAG